MEMKFAIRKLEEQLEEIKAEIEGSEQRHKQALRRIDEEVKVRAELHDRAADCMKALKKLQPPKAEGGSPATTEAMGNGYFMG